ncbi:hypothetical protein [Mesorhizobium sp. L-8-3]|uniref:hypothetical protein n=1 Tax=Mesorhizobium sp. L-8-3 TaxID=2744522 RepID=UPI0019253AC3|nr:hypothetical protein [Mesorhizobium sp. L-8-3]
METPIAVLDALRVVQFHQSATEEGQVVKAFHNRDRFTSATNLSAALACRGVR